MKENEIFDKVSEFGKKSEASLESLSEKLLNTVESLGEKIEEKTNGMSEKLENKTSEIGAGLEKSLHEMDQKIVDTVVSKVDHKTELEHTVTLVASDLDGTLLNGRKEVSKENREAIKRLKQHGILFGISSGRPVETIIDMVEGWGLSQDIGFISGMNGGAIYDYRQQKKEDYYLLDGEVIIDVIEFFKKLDVIFQVLVGKDRYVNKSTEETRAHAKLFGENEIEVDLYEFLKGRKVNKLIMFFDPEYQDFVLERAYEYNSDKCVGFFTSANLFEYVDPHINKGFGMKKLAEHFGTSIDYIVAFGDDSNDKEMLQTVGMGVAMKNARDEVKEVSNYVSRYTNEQNAIAHFIDDYILKEK